MGFFYEEIEIINFYELFFPDVVILGIFTLANGEFFNTCLELLLELP